MSGLYLLLWMCLTFSDGSRKSNLLLAVTPFQLKQTPMYFKYQQLHWLLSEQNMQAEESPMFDTRKKIWWSTEPWAKLPEIHSQCSMLCCSELLTCQSEQRGLAKTVDVSVFEQVESRQRGVQEEAGFGVGLQRVVAGDPGVPVENKGGCVPECHALLPLGQPHLAAGAHVQEVVRSVGRLKGNPWCVCIDETQNDSWVAGEHTDTLITHITLYKASFSHSHTPDVWWKKFIN